MNSPAPLSTLPDRTGQRGALLMVALLSVFLGMAAQLAGCKSTQPDALRAQWSQSVTPLVQNAVQLHDEYVGKDAALTADAKASALSQSAAALADVTGSNPSAFVTDWPPVRGRLAAYIQAESATDPIAAKALSVVTHNLETIDRLTTEVAKLGP